MIALSLYKNKKLKLVNKKISNKVKPKGCRIKILYSGVCASDIPRAFQSMAYRYPLVMGHEFVGRVIKTGSKVNNFEIGDLVSAFPLIPCQNCEYCNNTKYNLCEEYDYYGSRRDGSFSEVLDVNEWNIIKVKENQNTKLYSLMEPTAVSFNIYENIKRKIERNTNILLLGGGFIGQITFRIIKNFNKNINLNILDRNKFKLKKINFQNHNKILTSSNFKRNLDIFKSLKNKYDIVIETTGSDEHFLNAINFAKKGGLVLYSGNINKNLLIKKNEVSNILRKELSIKGVWNSTFKSKVDNWKQAEKFLNTNQEIENLITHIADLNDSANLLIDINLKKTGKVKNDYLKGLIKTF